MSCLVISMMGDDDGNEMYAIRAGMLSQYTPSHDAARL